MLRPPLSYNCGSLGIDHFVVLTVSLSRVLVQAWEEEAGKPSSST